MCSTVVSHLKAIAVQTLKMKTIKVYDILSGEATE